MDLKSKISLSFTLLLASLSWLPAYAEEIHLTNITATRATTATPKSREGCKIPLQLTPEQIIPPDNCRGLLLKNVEGTTASGERRKIGDVYLVRNEHDLEVFGKNANLIDLSLPSILDMFLKDGEQGVYSTISIKNLKVFANKSVSPDSIFDVNEAGARLGKITFDLNFSGKGEWKNVQIGSNVPESDQRANIQNGPIKPLPKAVINSGKKIKYLPPDSSVSEQSEKELEADSAH